MDSDRPGVTFQGIRFLHRSCGSMCKALLTALYGGILLYRVGSLPVAPDGVCRFKGRKLWGGFTKLRAP